MPKSYLGDAVYVDFDGYALVLTTEDGIRETNRIELEPGIYNALVQYVEHLKANPVEQGKTTNNTTSNTENDN